MIRNKFSAVFLGAMLVLALTGCYKDGTVVLDTGAAINRTVTFNTDIVPMFNNSCNMSGCHSTGGKTPDLSAANAYTALMNGYVNTEQPESSEVFLWMTGKRGSPMPLSGIKKDYNALILAWIKQGAINN
jgi:hypothetical protein